MLVDQAVYTSARSARFAGYHLVAVSPGVTSDEARELAAWGPSHDALAGGVEGRSVQFHPLASGRWAIGQTWANGSEYSGRGRRVYTQSLLVDAEVLGCFGGSAWALCQAAQAQGVWQALDPVPPQLPALELQGEAATVDELALAEAVAEVGVEPLSRLVEALLREPQVAVPARVHAPALAVGVLNALPAEVRPAVSFATGLKFAPKRPFRLLLLPAEPGEVRQLQRQFKVPVVDPFDSRRAIAHPWAELLASTLAAGRYFAWARQLGTPRYGLRLEDLGNLARELRGALSAEPLIGIRHGVALSRPLDGVASHRNAAPHLAVPTAPTDRGDLVRPGRDDSPTQVAQRAAASDARPSDAGDERSLVQELLAAALEDDPRARQHLCKLWNEAAAADDPLLVAELRARLVADLVSELHRTREAADSARQRGLAALEIVERLLAPAP
jgi:hypothetical protein